MISRSPHSAEFETTTPRKVRPADLLEMEAQAREFLEALGRGDHPDAHDNPLFALYQVAVDFRCTAYGYRALYLEGQGFGR